MTHYLLFLFTSAPQWAQIGEHCARAKVGSAHQLPRDASSVPCLSVLPAGHKGTPCANTLMGSLWQSSSRPLCLRRQLSLPNLFHEEHGCPGPRVAQLPSLCVPSNCSATAGTQTSQGTTAQASSNRPPPGGTSRGCLSYSSCSKQPPWPIPLRRDLLSQANGTLWHPRPELWALHVWPINGSLSTSQSVS